MFEGRLYNFDYLLDEEVGQRWVRIVRISLPMLQYGPLLHAVSRAGVGGAVGGAICGGGVVNCPVWRDHVPQGTAQVHHGTLIPIQTVSI